MNGTEKGPWRQRTLTWAVAAAVVVLLLGALWWAVWNGSSADPGAVDPIDGSPASGASAQPGEEESNSEDVNDGTDTEDRGSLDRDGVTRPSAEPGQTAPTEVVAPSGPLPRPIRAGLRERVAVDGGVAVELVRFESVRGKGRGPGETSGPAVRVTIEVRNASQKRLDTQASVLTAYYGPDTRPAIDLSAPGARNLPLSVPAGRTATGRYVFRIPEGGRENVRFDFSFSTEVPKVIYTGAV